MGSRIGVEATGTYHELFAEAAHQLGFLVFLLNPKDTRHYAKAVGLRGKTDRVDAELIARMIAHEHTKLHAWIPPTPQQREIDRLIKRRATLICLREAAEMSLHELDGFAADLTAPSTSVVHDLMADCANQWPLSRIASMPATGQVLPIRVAAELSCQRPFGIDPNRWDGT